ncbi:MAG TPA: helix-turn-helix domain-containing protein [Acidimicrobiia bacterium]|jgi:AcrR family transcriptional regulator|nr:helix-turn-helix domain-containing protein [Acidimicrobiia bacterium]
MADVEATEAGGDLDLLRRASRASESPRANSRAALVDAAFEEFSTRGYEEATVAGIAERAGVTTGALYAHFAGKLDLLLATVGLTPAADVVDSIAGLAALPWSEASRIMSHGLATPPDRGMLLLLDVIVVARRDPHVKRILRRGLETYLDAMKEANDKGVALGVIDPALRTDELARLFALLTFGRMVFAALDEPPPSDEAFGRFTDLVMQSAGGDGDETRPAALARVRARATTAERAQRSLHDSLVDAVEAGHSLRQVGAAAGLSHERVRQVLRERGERQSS